MSPKSMSAKEVSEALPGPAHGFSVPDLYPERVYDDSHDKGYDSAWDLHTEYSTFKLKVFSVLKSQNRRIKLWTKYTHMFDCMVMVVSCLFVEIWLSFIPSPTWVLWRKLFIQKCFRKMEWRWETQKKSEKRELVKDKWYNQMGQVGTSWSRGTSGTRRGGSSDLSGTSGTRRRGSWDLRRTSGTRTRGLSTWTIPLVSNGTTRSWTSSSSKPF